MQSTELPRLAPGSIKGASSTHVARLADIGKAVSYVTHEMRNSLQRIMLGIDELRLELGDTLQGTETLGEIDRDVDLLNDMVRDLLNYSKPLRLKCFPHSIGEVVTTALRRLSHRMRNITIHTEFEDEGKKVMMDCDRMVQVFVNLISNAADAMPEGGDLTISAAFHWQAGSEVLKISVTDSGCGIDEQKMREIQQPFITTKTQGIGLGIPICKNIVSSHNGSFELSSIPGLGTTVEIILPAEGA